jgi:hypothetical protein
MDDNRAFDGMDLRYRFACKTGYSQAMVAHYLDDRQCSVLEMMVALVNRCEEEIMDDPDLGDRKKEWFLSMIKSLGLKQMTDSRFNPGYVDRVITRFLNRDYAPNGEGGLFTVNDSRCDMRRAEIWHQMNWYLDEILRKGDGPL